MSLPRVIMVYEEQDKDETFLVANYDLDAAAPPIGEKRVIGIYKLVGRRLVRTVPKIVKELRV